MPQGAYLSDTSIPGKEETQGNAEDPNLRTYGRDRKQPSPYEPYFEVKRYRDQTFSMKIEDNMMTTNSLNSVAANTIIAQVLNTDPAQEAPGAHVKM